MQSHLKKVLKVMEDPLNCDRCNSSLERGYSQLYKGDTLVESICFDCDRKEILNRYIDNEILTSKIITESILDECSIRYKDKRVLPAEIYDKIQNSRNKIVGKRSLVWRFVKNSSIK